MLRENQQMVYLMYSLLKNKLKKVSLHLFLRTNLLICFITYYFQNIRKHRYNKKNEGYIEKCLNWDSYIVFLL